jgi:hypothetical protein
MVKPPTGMAPVLKPEDLKKEYVYGLDAESIRRGSCTSIVRLNRVS